MLLRKSRSRRIAAAAFLCLMLSELLLPAASYALTSGPTAPEATSFEPIDTTDMVNLQTGDFTYNMPLLEVPGPEGGYPLSLSYHAGIQPNEDASWVGLGWTLNPGAISRNVNGFPDDWNNQQTNSHEYWEGGSTSTYSVGVNIGIANTPVSVGANLSFSQDTYRGFGVGGSLSLGRSVGISNIASLNASIGIGVSPYGYEGYAFGGAGTGIGLGKGFSASAGVGFQTNFESVNAGFSSGVGYGKVSKETGRSFGGSVLGASISTGGGKPSLSVGGLSSSVSASTEASVQTDGFSFSVDVPVYYFNLSLGYSKMRYWIDKSTNIHAHGSLYSTTGWSEISETIGGNSLTNMVPYDWTFDSYSLLEDPVDKNMVTFSDPLKVQGGAYPDFDNYRVTAQGLGGSMRPYQFQGEVLGQNRKKDGSRTVNYYSPGSGYTAPQFRFEGDFSNRYLQSFTAYSNPNLNLRIVSPVPFATPIYGDGDAAYSYSGGKLAGTKHIDVGVAIKPSNSLGYVKSQRYQTGMIEGFSITNESGVTYHYGLPAYSWGEENYQEKIRTTEDNSVRFNRGIKTVPYAYTWYLTSITGPDFVDRDASGTNGYQMANEGDWGYWVNFEYGKWSNQYAWRNPSEGYTRDEDNQFQNCSMGFKEIYYLNAIRTRSHVALFEKDIRLDGKGASPEIFQKKTTTKDYQSEGIFNGNSSQSLRLNKIYLLNAEDAAFVLPTSGNSDAFKPTGSTRIYGCDCELAANILDKTDVEAVTRYQLETKAIRVIDFNYDYSLCKGVSNSFDINAPLTKFGKLTLKNVLLRSRGGASLIPPTKFEYELSSEDQVSQTGVQVFKGGFEHSNGNFQVGDIIRDVNGLYDGLITRKAGPFSGTYSYNLGLVDLTLGGNSSFAGAVVDIVTTKNPKYDKNAFDLWGMPKGDVDPYIMNRVSQNMARRTSIGSAKATDAWSLRKITLPTGNVVKVKYESKLYTSVLNGDGSIMATILNQSSGKLAFGVANNDFETIKEVCPVGTKVDITVLFYLSSPYGNHAFDSREHTLGDIVVDSYVTGGPFPVVMLSGPTLAQMVATINSSGPQYSVRAANLIFGTKSVQRGGGIRVSKITNFDGSTIFSSSYNYKNPATNNESGLTSYDPISLDVIKIIDPDYPMAVTDAEKEAYRAAIYNNIHTLLAISREIPPPGVMHEYVTVTNKVKNAGESEERTLTGSTTYQFEVFRENMIWRNMLESPFLTGSANGTINARNLSIKKFLHSIGSVRRIIQYDKDGKKLSETINHFLHDGLEGDSKQDFFANYKARLSLYSYLGHNYDLKSQGLLQERYSEVKTIDEQGWTAASQVKATMSAREDYPCIPLGQTVINYVTGVRTTSQNLAFDFYSGALTKSVETDAYGNRIMTETRPAYREYSSLGLKTSSAGNKNMLTQTAGTVVYRVDAANTKLGIVSASANTWSNTIPAIDATGAQFTQNYTSSTSLIGNVWRQQSSYGWMPVNVTSDGLTPTASFSAFNYTTPASSNANWKKTGEITLTDVYSKPLEAKDMYNNYAATRMNFQHKKVEVSGGPAKYHEIAFSGAEDDNIDQTANGFVKKADGTAVSTAGVAHTGVKSLKLGANGKKGFVYTIDCNKLTVARDYIVSVWVKPVSGSASDVKLYYDKGAAVLGTSTSSGASAKTAGSWNLIQLKINGTDITANTTINIGCRNDHSSAEAYVDDFRFQPFTSTTTAYVYDKFSGELTHVLDNSNLYTRYEYDASGRLTATYREKIGVGEYKVGAHQYNFASTVSFSSDEINQTYTKSDCALGATGSTILIHVDAGAFTSLISLEDANLKARSYAQYLANTQGSCAAPTVTVNLTNTVGANNYKAVLNNIDYTFPQSGTSTFSLSAGTYSIGVVPIGSADSSYTFKLTLPGSATVQAQGTEAWWYNKTVNSGTLTLTIE